VTTNDRHDSLFRLAMRHLAGDAHRTRPAFADRVTAHCSVRLPDWVMARATPRRLVVLCAVASVAIRVLLLPLRLLSVVTWPLRWVLLARRRRRPDGVGLPLRGGA
jgi:hypothetical protein